MNIIFATQGNFAFFYLDLLPLFKQKLAVERIGFYVTNKSNHLRYVNRAKELGLNVKFLKGWELASIGGEKLDYDFLKRVEREFGEPFLWNALLMDRRVYNGILAKFKQDYKPRFSHEEMLFLLQKGFKSILEFIDEIKPDIIIGGFTPVTYAEYIFYLCAKAKKIRYINLNPTKIENFVTFSEEAYREFPHIALDYRRYLDGGGEDDFIKKAKDYLHKKDKKYEGVVISSPKFPYEEWFVNVLKLPFVIGRYYLKRAYSDNQVKGYHWGYFYKYIYNPLRDRLLCKFFPYYPAEKLSHLEYAYYPLHVEPEIALSLFGREYLNQVELIRNIARSIPVSWKLVIKDHPAGVGRRNIRYYKKLLEIPNVVIVNHYANSDYLIKNSKIVFTVSGFTGFEAIMSKKPVITFGKAFYNVLPSCTVRRLNALENLPMEIKDLLETYEHRENNVASLVAAVIKNSLQLNLYRDVLKKLGRVTMANQDFEIQKKNFSDYMVKFIQKRESPHKVDFDYNSQPKEELNSCGLCGSSHSMVISKKDRYGFDVPAHLCLECGLIYISPRMTEEGYRLFYQRYYRPLVSYYRGENLGKETLMKEQEGYAQEVFKWISPFLTKKEGPFRILDVGGSTGMVANIFKENLNAKGLKVEATVIDPATDELAIAKALGLRTIEGLVEGVDIGRNCWDLILLCQTVDHLMDVKETISRLRSALAGEDGLFFMDIVDWEFIVRRKGIIEDAIKIDHPFNFTKGAITPFLERVGFQILSVSRFTDGHLIGFLCGKTTPAERIFSKEHVESILSLISEKETVPVK